MIKLNTNEKKKLKFNIRVSGVQPQDLKGSMKIIYEDVEYGFPIRIDDGDVIVEVKPFSAITGKEFKDGDILESKLELIAGDIYLMPWSDKIKIENPVKVEANITEVEDIDEEEITPVVSVAQVNEEEQEIEEHCGMDHDEEDDTKKKNKKKKPKTRFGKILGDE